MSVAVEEGMSGTAGGHRAADDLAMRVDVIGHRAGSAERAQVDHRAVFVEEGVVDPGGTGTGDPGVSDHLVVVVQVRAAEPKPASEPRSIRLPLWSIDASPSESGKPITSPLLLILISPNVSVGLTGPTKLVMWPWR